MKLRWWGSLVIAGLYGTAASGSDFTLFVIGKGVYYDQTKGATPVKKLPFPYLFSAQVWPVSNAILFASVRTPSGRSLFLQGAFLPSPRLLYERKPDQPSLDAAFTNGDYRFDLHTTNGHQFATNRLAAGSFPNVPTIVNLVEAGAVDAAKDFVLLWEPFSGGTAADFIQCQLQTVGQTAFVTSLPGNPGALDGTATSVTIPAGTLLPGRAYLGRVLFAVTQASSTDTNAGTTTATFYFNQTDFWLRTQGPGNSVPPEIASTSPTNGAVNVPWNMPIGVHFTKPMRTSYSVLQINGLGGFSVNLSPDGQQLVLTPSPGSSSAGPCSYIFNSLGHNLAFGDTNGNPLAAETFVLSLTRSSVYKIPGRAVLTDPELQTDGSFQMNLHGETNYSYAIEYSSNLTNWLPLRNAIAFDGIASVIDTNIGPGVLRAYRAYAR
jgi:hypothetical protein